MSDSMRAYGSKSFQPRRHGGIKWRGLLIALAIGFVGGFLFFTGINVRQPVELIISTPPWPEVADEANREEVWSESQNISVRRPRADTLVVSPLVVEGLERTFEQNVVVRLKDGQDQEIAKTVTTGTAPDLGIHGPYRAELIFAKPKTKTGTLEVFQNSPKDGQEIDKVTIPVRFE